MSDASPESTQPEPEHDSGQQDGQESRESILTEVANDNASPSPVANTTDANTTDVNTTDVKATDNQTDKSSSTGSSTGSSTASPPRFMNPVLWRETRTRFESRRTAWVVLAYVVILGGLVTLVYVTAIRGGDGSPAVTRLGVTGRNVFEMTVVMTAVLIMLLIPPQAASSITSERERQTLMPMQITLLRPIQIVLGKLGASVIFTILLITLTAPILTLGFVIGGVTIGNVVVSVALLIVIALLTTTISIWWSSVARRSSTAIVLTMVTLFVMMAGSGIAYTAAYIAHGGFSDTPSTGAPQFLLSSNPLMALADAVGERERSGGTDRFGSPVFAGPLTEARQNLISTSGHRLPEWMIVPDPNAPEGVIVGMPGNGESGVEVEPGSDQIDSSAPAVVTTLPADSESSVTGDETGSTSDSSSDFMPPATVGAVFDQGVMLGDLGPDVTLPPGFIAVDIRTGEPVDLQKLVAVRDPFPLWALFLIFAGVMMMLTTWGAARRLRTPANTER